MKGDVFTRRLGGGKLEAGMREVVEVGVVEVGVVVGWMGRWGILEMTSGGLTTIYSLELVSTAYDL